LDASRDISGCHLPQESLSDRIAKFSLFSLRAVLQLDLQCVVSFSPQRTTSIFTFYSPIYYDNKPVSFPPQKCGWSLLIINF